MIEVGNGDVAHLVDVVCLQYCGKCTDLHTRGIFCFLYCKEPRKAE